MAVALERIIRLTAQARGAQEVTSLNDAITKLDLSVKDLGETSEKTGEKIEKASNQGENWKAVLGVAALVAGLTVATRDAVVFESGMADVRKVVDGLEAPPALKEISAEIISLSQKLPMTAEGFSQIYAAAGQSGIAKKDIKDFAVTVTNVATAFDMTAEQAGTSLAQIKTSLGLTIPELSKLADAMNFVENSTGATASGLVEFMTRAGAFGQLAGLNAKETLAFGAAMTQAGVQSEVAATSFNNMVRALSRGPAMTERQVEALLKLGYSLKNAGQIEKELSEKAEKESKNRVQTAQREEERTVRIASEQAEKRIAIAEKETEKLIKEILKRYRQQQKIQENNWEDEDIQRRRIADKKLDDQLYALDQEKQNAIKAEKEKQKALKIENDQAIAQIEKFYDDRMDALRNNAEDENRLIERQIKERREAIETQTEEQKDTEINAAREKLKNQEKQEEQELNLIKQAAKKKLEAIENAEKIQLERSKEQAKKTGETLGKESAQAFSDRFQADAVGVISEVLQKIGNLPKSQQISVLSDLFGEEARGLAPMLSNLDELQRILSLVTQEQNYANSTSKEAAVRFTTSAAKLQVFNNNMTALKIAIGDTLLPLLLGIVEPLQAITKGFTGVITAAQGFISGVIERTVLLSVFSKAIVSATGLIVSFGIAIGGVMSLATITRWAGGIKLLGLLPGPLRLIAVLLTAVGVAATPLGPILSAIGTALFAIQSIKFGISIIQGLKTILPLLGQLSVALRLGPLVGAMTTALTGLLTWMATTFVPAMVAFFSGPVGWIALGVAALIAGMIFFREPIMKFFEWALGQIGDFWKGVWAFIYDTQLKPWVDLWNKVLKKPVTDFGTYVSTFLQVAWNKIIEWANKNFLKRWDNLWDGIQKAPERVKNTVTKWFTDLYKNTIDTWNGIPAMLQNIWDRVTQGMSSTWRNMTKGVINMINSVIGLWNSIAKKTTGFAGLALPIITPIANTQAFARGGFVSQPTLGLVGEGANPREYVIPESGMDAAAAGWQAGLRGNQLVAAWQSPGLAPGRATTAPAGGGAVQITITGGTVQLPDGRQMVTIEQAQAIAAATLRANAPAIVRASIQASGEVLGSAAGRARYGVS